MTYKKLMLSTTVALMLIGGGSWLWKKTHQPTDTAAEASLSSGNHGQEGAADKPGRHGGDGRGKRGGRGKWGGDKPSPVTAATVKIADIPVTHTALGTAIPSAVVTVTSRVAGQLVQVAFQEGQLVKQGQLLAKIDSRPFETALSQIQGQALRNQALLKNSQIDLERFKTLQAQDSIASQQVDSQASLVQQYQGTVQADHASVESAKLQLAFTNITAPISGRIGLRQVDNGNNITTTNPIAVINAIHPIHVVFTLPEDKITALLQQTQSTLSTRKLKVEAWDKNNTQRLATGVLASIDNQIDTTSGTLKLKAEFSNEDNRLFPNQFVNVKLFSETLPHASVIPLNALQYGPEGAFVYKILPDEKGDKVILQSVTVGHTDGEVAAITKGLVAGDRVVSSGIDKLKQNAKVRVKDPNRPDTAAADEIQGQHRRRRDGQATEGVSGAEPHPHRRRDGGV